MDLNQSVNRISSTDLKEGAGRAGDGSNVLGSETCMCKGPVVRE